MSIGAHISDPLNSCQAVRESNLLAHCYNIEAMEIVEDIRRSNLKSLVIQYGSVRKLADILGKSSSQLSQWLNASVDSKSGKPRVVSSPMAREIEGTLEKPRGWLDSPIHPYGRLDVLLPEHETNKNQRAGDAAPPLADTMPPEVKDLARRMAEALSDGRMTTDGMDLMRRMLDQITKDNRGAPREEQKTARD